jgi:hypothetical protein
MTKPSGNSYTSEGSQRWKEDAVCPLPDIAERKNEIDLRKLLDLLCLSTLDSGS